MQGHFFYFLFSVICIPHIFYYIRKAVMKEGEVYYGFWSEPFASNSRGDRPAPTPELGSWYQTTSKWRWFSDGLCILVERAIGGGGEYPPRQTRVQEGCQVNSRSIIDWGVVL